jgi:hypothetical protein
MEIARGKKFLLTRSDPAVPGGRLTLWAVPVSAAIVRDGAIPATSAFVEMTAECGGATPLNGPQYFHVLPAKPVAVLFDEQLSRSADDIGHLERWPAHLFLADGLVVDK